MITFGQNVLDFSYNLTCKAILPSNIQILNPQKENPQVKNLTSQFYLKYYNDYEQRKMIIGINPGRLGAGSTGIPFTDTKRLQDVCGIKLENICTHEPSSVFIYNLIDISGGPLDFYKQFYITSVCPLGFVLKNSKGNIVNCNYYDFPELFNSVKPFIYDSLINQLSFGIDSDVCYVLGKKNAVCFKTINDHLGIFKKIEVLEHPRYIMQYQAKSLNQYLSKYQSVLFP